MYSKSQNMLSWNGPTRIIEVISWLCTRPSQGLHHVLRVVSKHLLNSVRLGAMTAFLGSLFQCSTTFWMKNVSYYLIRMLSPALTKTSLYQGKWHIISIELHTVNAEIYVHSLLELRNSNYCCNHK